MTVPEAEQRAGVKLEDVLRRIGTHKTQVVIMVMTGMAYASFMEQAFLTTLANVSVWKKWPYLEHDKPTYNAVFATAAICRLISSLLFIPLNDVLGRRFMLLASLSVLCIGCGINAAATTFPFYCAMRGLCMVAASILPSTTTMYTMEMVSIKRRALPSTILQCFHVLAIIYVTVINMCLTASANSWRRLYLWALAPMLISLLLMPFVFFETPRFLIATGREDKAWRVLGKLTRGGEDELASKLNVPSIQNCFIDGAMEKQTPHSAVQKITENLIRMCQVAVHKDLRCSTFIVSLLWALVAFAYWGANSYMTTFFKYIGIASNGATLACFLVQLPGMGLVYWIMNREGRIGGRVVAMRICALGCSSGLIALTVVIAAGVKVTWPIWLLAMYTYFFTGPIWNALYIYSAELYPTNVRGAAMALFSVVNAIATLVTCYVGSLTVDNTTKWLYPLIWGASWLVALAVTFALRTETATRDLAERV